MPCPDGDSRSACSAVQVDVHWNNASSCGRITGKKLSNSSPLWLTEPPQRWFRPFSSRASAEAPALNYHWVSTASNLWDLISRTDSGSVLQTLAIFLIGFLSEALNRKLSKEVSAGTHWDLWGTHSVVTIIKFVYLQLAKLSVSCQHLKSCHSGHSTFTERTWYRCGREALKDEPCDLYNHHTMWSWATLEMVQK